jgi:hypothetical protein
MCSLGHDSSNEKQQDEGWACSRRGLPKGSAAFVVAVTLGVNRTSGPVCTYQVTMSTGTRGELYLARIETTTGKVDTWKMTSSSFQRK